MGVKHTACGPKPTLQRFRSGPRDYFAKYKNYTAAAVKGVKIILVQFDLKWVNILK